MTLAEKLLPKLSEWQPAGDGRHSWSHAPADAGWTVTLSADKADSLSCLVWELTLNRTADAPDGLTLRGWAAAVAGRVAGLMEPLKLHEIDDTQKVAVLRSQSPTARGDALAYYEVRLNGLTGAVVRRYHGSRAGGPREQVAFALTHEVLAKLAGDVAG